MRLGGKIVRHTLVWQLSRATHGSGIMPPQKDASDLFCALSHNFTLNVDKSRMRVKTTLRLHRFQSLCSFLRHPSS